MPFGITRGASFQAPEREADGHLSATRCMVLSWRNLGSNVERGDRTIRLALTDDGLGVPDEWVKETT